MRAYFLTACVCVITGGSGLGRCHSQNPCCLCAPAQLAQLQRSGVPSQAARRPGDDPLPCLSHPALHASPASSAPCSTDCNITAADVVQVVAHVLLCRRGRS